MLLKPTQSFLIELFKIGAVKIDTVKGFKLALHKVNPLAPPSPFYISLRTPENKDGKLQQPHVDSIATELIAAASHAKFVYDAVAGIPRAGTPFAKAVTRLSNGKKVPYVSITKRTDMTGSMRIDPRKAFAKLGSGTRVLLVDDLITQADTKLAAISAVQKAGYKVAGIAVYLDREQGGVRSLRQSGVPIVAVVKIRDMLAFYEQDALISANEAQIIRKYLGH